MDFVDTFLYRFDNEVETKKPGSVLVCFADRQIGKVLCRLAAQIIRSKSEKSSITLLYCIDKAEMMRRKDEMDEYQNEIINDFLPAEEKEKILLRLFIKPEDDFHADIIKISEEQKTNLIFLGIRYENFNFEQEKKYNKLQNDPVKSDIFILKQFNEMEAGTLKNINVLFNKNMTASGLFIDKGVKEMKKLFVPILSKADIFLFLYLYRIALKEDVKIMIWDAIGIMETEPKMQKFFQYIVKKTEGRIHLWNNDRKIGTEFIEGQDLIIAGTEGWQKLICTPLQWTNFLPSVLIIKENTN